jgi:hypothetical protein
VFVPPRYSILLYDVLEWWKWKCQSSIAVRMRKSIRAAAT